MPELGVKAEDGRVGGWRRLTPGRWARRCSAMQVDSDGEKEVMTA